MRTYAYIHSHTYSFTHMYLHTLTHTDTHNHTHEHIHTHTHALTYAVTHTHFLTYTLKYARANAKRTMYWYYSAGPKMEEAKWWIFIWVQFLKSCWFTFIFQGERGDRSRFGDSDLGNFHLHYVFWLSAEKHFSHFSFSLLNQFATASISKRKGISSFPGIQTRGKFQTYLRHYLKREKDEDNIMLLIEIMEQQWSKLWQHLKDSLERLGELSFSPRSAPDQRGDWLSPLNFLSPVFIRSILITEVFFFSKFLQIELGNSEVGNFLCRAWP